MKTANAKWFDRIRSLLHGIAPFSITWSRRNHYAPSRVALSKRSPNRLLRCDRDFLELEPSTDRRRSLLPLVLLPGHLSTRRRPVVDAGVVIAIALPEA